MLPLGNIGDKLHRKSSCSMPESDIPSIVAEVHAINVD